MVHDECSFVSFFAEYAVHCHGGLFLCHSTNRAACGLDYLFYLSRRFGVLSVNRRRVRLFVLSFYYSLVRSARSHKC